MGNNSKQSTGRIEYIAKRIFSDSAPHKDLTEISTMPVRARTRTVSKKVKRFLLVGRVVRKKLTRAMQEMLEAVKESRQRSNFTASAIPCSNSCFSSFLKIVDVLYLINVSHTSSLNGPLLGINSL